MQNLRCLYHSSHLEELILMVLAINIGCIDAKVLDPFDYEAEFIDMKSK